MKRQRQKKRFIGVVFVSTVGFVLALFALENRSIHRKSVGQ